MDGARPRHPEAASAPSLLWTRTEKPAVPHGVAGWHTPVKCLQPWASAMGSVPALPQASSESTSKALVPCSTSTANKASVLVGWPLGAQT